MTALPLSLGVAGLLLLTIVLCSVGHVFNVPLPG